MLSIRDYARYYATSQYFKNPRQASFFYLILSDKDIKDNKEMNNIAKEVT